jgi:enediyne biosynthesis protein E4
MAAWMAAPQTPPWTVVVLPFQLQTGETARKHLPATMPGGIAVFDFDEDGRLDLFFANGATLPAQQKTSPNRLLRNLGGFRFVDVTARAGLVTTTGYDFGAALGDYDRDGHMDLLVTGLTRLTLYRNNGNGTFTDVTAKAGLDRYGRWSIAAAFFDMENDGDVDLFVGNYVQWNAARERVCLVAGQPDFCHPQYYAAQPSALFRNNGDGTFTEASASFREHPGKAMGVAAADFDGDGLTDLFVTNDREFAQLFRNLGNGQFREEALERGAAVPGDGQTVSAMGADAQDYDNDGRPDLIYTALRDETFPLLRNAGEGFAENRAMGPLTREWSGWGVAFADLDNDGWKDVAVARSGVLSATAARGAGQKEPPGWLRNQAGVFAAGGGWEKLEPLMYRGLVAADLNDDGCLDVVLTALQAPARILRNPCAGGGNWLKVASKVAGGEARVRVDEQWRETSTAVSYGSAYAGPLHFGLGAARQATLTIGKGAPRVVAANQTIRP